MSLVAVVKRAADKAGALPVTQVVPIGMPQDTAFDAYFAGTAPAGGGPVRALCAIMPPNQAQSSALPMPACPAPAQSEAQKLRKSFARGLIDAQELAERLLNPTGSAAKLTGVANVRSRKTSGTPRADTPALSNQDSYSADSLGVKSADNTDRLLDIASHLEPDGGVTGEGLEDRALKTINAVLFFLSEGHTPNSGAFRAHVERLVRFLETLDGLSFEHRAIADSVVAFARACKKPRQSDVKTWNDVGSAIA